MLKPVSAIPVILSMIAIFFLMIRVGSLQGENAKLNSQIQLLQQQRELVEKRYEQAESDAHEEMRRLQDKSDLIMNEKVSKNCEESIKWAINQAKGFK